MRTCLILFFFPLILASCDEKTQEELKADCYFQSEYVNYAWGFQHSGFIITPAGEIYTFDRSTPWVFAENGKLSVADLKKNLSASIKKDTLINKSDIEYYTRLAMSAMNGKLSTPVTQGADMGGHGCSIFIPGQDDKQVSYRQVILTEFGDIEQHNLASEASVIADWLTQLKFH